MFGRRKRDKRLPLTFLQRLKKTTTIWSLALLAIGIFCLIRPGDIMLILCMLIGLALLIFGLTLVIDTLLGMNSGQYRAVHFPTFSLIFGVVIAVIGFIFVIRPQVIVDFIGILIAVILILHGVNDLLQMQLMVRYRDRNWWLALIGAVVTVIGGLFVAINPFGTAGWLVRIMGIALILSGGCGFLINWHSSRVERNYFLSTEKKDGKDFEDIIDGEAEFMDEESKSFSSKEEEIP